MSTDPTDRLLDSLSDSTKAQQTAARRIDALERRLEGLEHTVGERLEGLEREMGTMNAKLDNLVREVQLTNFLLKQDGDERREERQRQRQIEDEERAHKLKLEEEDRKTWRAMGAEMWRIVNQPLALLIAGIVAWLLYQHFPVPLPGPESVPVQLEQPSGG